MTKQRHETRILHDGPLAHKLSALTATGLKQASQHSRTQPHMEGFFASTRHGGALHADAHKDVRQAESNICTQTSTASISTSGAPNRETRSARSCSTPILQHITEPLSNLTVADNILSLRPLCWTTSPQPQQLAAYTYTLREPKIISNKTSTSTKKEQHDNVHQLNVEILPPEGQIEYIGQITTFEKRSPSRVRPPYQMRVGNLHEAQAGVDVTKTPLRDRLKLFDATVTPSLSASGT